MLIFFAADKSGKVYTNLEYMYFQNAFYEILYISLDLTFIYYIYKSVEEPFT